jgi:hypothetical protein
MSKSSEKRAAALNKRPTSTATPLGTPKSRSARKTKQTTEPDSGAVVNTGAMPAENAVQHEKDVALQSETAVESSSSAPSAVSPSTQSENPNGAGSAQETQNAMEVTLTRNDKQRKSTSVVYTSDQIRGSVRFAKSSFTDGNAPETIVVNSDAFAAPKPKLTPEQRKEARKNAPKLTAAERLAKAEARLAKLREKAAAEQAAANAPAAGEQPAQG